MKKRFFGTLLMGAFLIASMSMFVSCKDYDDDINKNTSDITALQSQVQTLKTALDQAKSDATAAHALYATKSELAAKADPSDVAAVKKALDEAVSALSAEVKAMVTADQLTKAIEAAQATLQAAIDGKASQADLDALALKVAAIDPQLNQIKTDLLAEIDKAAKAANDNIEAQKKAIEALEAALKAANDVNAAQDAAIKALQDALGGEGDSESIKALADDIVALKASVATLASADAVKALEDRIAALEAANSKLAEIQASVATATQDVADVKVAMKEASDMVDKAAATVNLLTVFVDKRLTSLVLRPDFYWGGIEAVECPALYNVPIYCVAKNEKAAVVGDYTKSEQFQILKSKEKFYAPGMPYDSTYTYTPLAEATYHMNPSSANIAGNTWEFYSNIAAVRTRANGHGTLAIPANDGVIAESDYANGFLTVKFTPDWEYIYKLARTGSNRYAGYAENYPNSSTTYTNPDPTDPTSTITTTRDYYSNLYVYDNQTGTVIDTLNVGGWYYRSNAVYNWLADSAAMVALKVNVGDTSVVSDYARLAPIFYENLYLADKTWKDYAHRDWLGSYDLFRDVVDRINSNSFWDTYTGASVSNVHPIVYDSKLNLSELIETHYTVRSYGGEAYVSHEVMSEEIMKKLNLHYEFDYIEYTKGGNMTDETQHIQLVKENDSVYAYPRNVDVNGKRIDNATANKSAVGREPVIRVTLVDNEGRIYSWGYEKIKIVSEAPKPIEPMTISFGGDYYMDCDANATLTWSQIEYNIYNNLLGISKTEFETQYRFDGYWGYDALTATTYPVFNQYVFVDGQYVNVNSKAYQPNPALANYWPYKEIGEVQEIRDANDPTTNVLNWHVYPADGDFQYIMDLAKIDEKGISTEALPVTVRFNNVAGGSPVYVNLDIPKTKLHFAVAEALGKTTAGWKQNNSEAAPTKADESDFAEVHYSVPTIAEHPANLADTEFSKDILESFKKRTVLLSALDPHFTKFAGAGVSFKFVAPEKGKNATNINAVEGMWTVKGVSGAEYTLAVSADGLKVQIVSFYDWFVVDRIPANATVLGAGAEIDVVTLNPVPGSGSTLPTLIKLANNRYAQDILNYVGYLSGKNATDKYTPWCTSEDEMFTVFLQIIPDNVAGCYDLLLKNNYFKVRFQRPINVYSKTKEITDAKNDVQEVKVTDLLGIKDWRLYNLASSSSDGSSNIKQEFYGVKNLTATNTTNSYQVGFYGDLRDAYTDYAATTRTLLDATQISKIEALDLVSDIPALETPYLTTNGHTWIKYTNKGDNVADFHIYVPIYVTYTYGEWLPYTQKVYGIITVKHTTNHARQD